MSTTANLLITAAAPKASATPTMTPIDYRTPEATSTEKLGTSTPLGEEIEPIAAKIPRISPPPKPASEGFSTPPSSSFLGAFKAPLSVPPTASNSFGLSCVSPATLPLQDNHSRNHQQQGNPQNVFQYGSPRTPEVEDLEFDTSKGKVTLWQFLLQLLLDSRYSDIIRWTNNAGEFVLLRAEEVARLWGLRKDNNHRMNYDKLSRALRYYYQKNIIRKVQGYKFVYKFIGLHRLKGPGSPYAADKPHREAPFAFEDVKPFRKQVMTSNGTPPALSLNSADCPDGFASAFRRQSPFETPLSTRPLSFSCQSKLTNSFAAAPKAPSRFHFESPPSPAPPVPLHVGLGFPSPATPAMAAHDFTKLFSNLKQKNGVCVEPVSQGTNMSGDDNCNNNNVKAIATWACRELFQALVNTRQQLDESKRSHSPNCHCTCHESGCYIQPTEPKAPLHFVPPPPVPRKQHVDEFWPQSGTPGDNHLEDPSTDHQSYLHWQRHLINMNRLKEQIQRVSGTESEKVMPPPAFCHNEERPKRNGTGNFIWMPIQVDLVGQIMAMLSSQQKSTGPPMAHTSTTP